MDVRDIFSGLDPSSSHRVSMEGPIFKPFGNPIALVMEILCPKPNYFTQSWVGTFPEIPQSNIPRLTFLEFSTPKAVVSFADTGIDVWGRDRHFM